MGPFRHLARDTAIRTRGRIYSSTTASAESASSAAAASATGRSQFERTTAASSTAGSTWTVSGYFEEPDDDSLSNDESTEEFVGAISTSYHSRRTSWTSAAACSWRSTDEPDGAVSVRLRIGLGSAGGV